jgi:hypothetical protein
MRLRSYYPAKIRWDADTVLEVDVKRLNFGEASDIRSRVRDLLEDAIRLKAIVARGEVVSTSEMFKKSEDLRRDVVEMYAKMRSHLVVELEDGKEVTVKTGRDILEHLGGRHDVLETIYDEVLRQNRVDEETKKKSSSPTDSADSSSEPSQGQAGQRPETTAAPAESADSAVNEGATPQAETQSGPTDGGPADPRSSSASAQSSR